MQHNLFDKQNRPLAAERLIREAIGVCEETHDLACLADAWSTYGFFFRSPSISRWHVVYRRDGFLDRTATLENRYEKSVEYSEKAAIAFSEQHRFDRATNAYLNIGWTLELAGRKIEACPYFSKSLDSYRRNIALNPNAKPIVPSDFSGYEDFLAAEMRRVGCK